jgi:O-antigen/teichoic acid export membrane protein
MDRLFDNLRHVLSANLVTGVVNFVSAVWFARSLGPAVMGDYAMMVVAIQLLTAVLSPGLNQALIRDPSNRSLAAAATFGTFVQSLLIMAVACVVYGWAMLVDVPHVTDLFLSVVGLTTATVVSLWVYLLSVPFESGLHYGGLVQVRIVALIVSTMAGVIAAQAGYGVHALIMRDLLSALLSLWLIRRRSPMLLTWKTWRAGLPDLIHFVRGLWPLNVLERLAFRLDYAAVGWLFDLETLGIYFAVRGMVEGAIGFLLSPIQTVLYAYYCRLADINGVVETILRKDRLALTGLGTIALMIVLQAGGDHIVAATLGHRYEGGQVLLGGLALYAVSVTWFEHLKVLAMSQGNHHSMAIARIIQLGLSLCLIYPLVRLFGLTGAGLSAGLAAAAMATTSTWILTRTVFCGTGGYRTSVTRL